jgi:hypothetical protein
MKKNFYMSQKSQRGIRMTLSLNPSPQGRETLSPSPLGGEGWVRGIIETMTNCEALLVTSFLVLGSYSPYCAISGGPYAA